MWIKLDASFFGHPKVVIAGREARDVYLAALCWSGAYFTDGHIPTGALEQLAADAGSADPDECARRLVAVGLWEKAPGGFQIHDYLRHQTSRAKMRATARKRAQAGALGGAAPSKQNGSKNEANGEANPEQTVEQSASATSPNGSANEPEELRSIESEEVNPPLPPPLDAGGECARDDEPIALRILKPWERDLAQAEQDPLFGALAEIDGRPVTRAAVSRTVEHLRALNELGATPDELRRRAVNYRLIMSPGIPLTVRALLNNWELCAEPPLPEPDDGVLRDEHGFRAAGAVAFAQRYSLTGKGFARPGRGDGHATDTATPAG